MKLGQLAAKALVQGGAGFHILTPSVFYYISGFGLSDVVVDIARVHDPAIREICQKVVPYSGKFSRGF